MDEDSVQEEGNHKGESRTNDFEGVHGEAPIDAIVEDEEDSIDPHNGKFCFGLIDRDQIAGRIC